MARNVVVRPLDLIMLGYLACMFGVKLGFRERVQHWWLYLLGITMLVALLSLLLKAHARHPGSRVMTLLRWGYPLVIMPICYAFLDDVVLVLHGRFLDDAMVSFEWRLFGSHPSTWFNGLAAAPVTELLYLFYMGFYLFAFVPPLLLYKAGRPRDLEKYVTTLAAAVYTCYLGFLTVPVLGPRYSLQGLLDPEELTGYVALPLQEWLISVGEPDGACFPSAHIAGAWAGFAAIHRIWGWRATRLLLVPTIVLTFATFYTRYHYLTDIVGGLAVAFAVIVLTRRMGNAPGAGS